MELLLGPAHNGEVSNLPTFVAPSLLKPAGLCIMMLLTAMTQLKVTVPRLPN